MNIILGVLGVIIVTVVVIDILLTTFYLTGAGFLSGRISLFMWNRLLKIHKKIKSNSFLGYAGSSIILVTFLIWAVLFLTGMTLIFSFSDSSIINAQTKIAATFWDKFYYVGFSTTTLGIGDFVAGSKFWEIFTVFSTITGFFLLTLVITYLIPLISSVEEKRGFASMINNIGSTPHKFLKQLRNGDNYDNLSQILVSCLSVINSMTQHHLAYPALHYFHSVEKKTASAPAIAILDEALSILEVCYSENYKEKSNLIVPVRDAINDLLITLENSFISSGTDAPGMPDSSTIKDLDLTPDDKKLSDYYGSIDRRRKLLLAYVNHDGWEWDDVIN